MQDICSNNPNIVYWQVYIADMTFRAHWRSLLVALIDRLDRYQFLLVAPPLELHLTTSELWFGQEQEGILP